MKSPPRDVIGVCFACQKLYFDMKTKATNKFKVVAKVSFK